MTVMQRLLSGQSDWQHEGSSAPSAPGSSGAPADGEISAMRPWPYLWNPVARYQGMEQS